MPACIGHEIEQVAIGFLLQRLAVAMIHPGTVFERREAERDDAEEGRRRPFGDQKERRAVIEVGRA